MFDYEMIRPAFEFGMFYIPKLVLDIPEERMAEQPFAGANHGAWTIGHLAWAHDNMVKMLGGGEPQLAGWKESMGMGSVPVADRGKYPSKEALLKALEEANGRLVAAVKGAPEEVLKQPTPERIRHLFPTVGQMMVGLMTGHYGSHMGQLSAWRRALGYRPVF